MIKHFYNRYSDDQKVSFWVVVSNIVLVIFTFGFGLLIQNSMVSTSAELQTMNAQYEYGSKILPAVEKIYNTGTSEILALLSQWNLEAEDNHTRIEDTLDSIYYNNRGLYLTSVDTMIHVMGELKYYIPQYRNDISKNNSILIMSSATLKELNNILLDSTSLIPSSSIKNRVMNSPDLWIYGSMDVSMIEVGLNQLDSLYSEIKKNNIGLRQLGDSIKNEEPELNKSIISICDADIRKYEKGVIPHLNKAYIKNLLLLQRISEGNITEHDDLNICSFFMNKGWAIFVVAIIIGVIISIYFTVIVFPRRVNRNHTTKDYELLQKRLKNSERQVKYYERIIKSLEDRPNSQLHSEKVDDGEHDTSHQ